VDIPAYDATEIYARSIAPLEKRVNEVLERTMQAKKKRQRLMLKYKIDEIIGD
jgi:hypothetical protein